MNEWKFFVLGRDKTPLANCAECRSAGPEHDREACTCLTCHGFYAATSDPDLLREMSRKHPDGRWAVRTGAASGIIVLDAEGAVDERTQLTGVEVLDDLEAWTGGVALPPTGTIAATPSGGVHRYYVYESGVRSKNRLLPGVDLKSDGGYVVMAGLEPSRRWLAEGGLGRLGAAFLRWAVGARRVGGGSNDDAVSGYRSEGYDFKRFYAEGCPGGSRDEFFNELLFRLRKAGVDRGLAVQQVRVHWKRCGQPGVPPGAKWYMPWHHVEGKMDHVWRTVAPDEVAEELQAWATAVSFDQARPGSMPQVGARRRARVSRVTIVPRSGS